MMILTLQEKWVLLTDIHQRTQNLHCTYLYIEGKRLELVENVSKMNIVHLHNLGNISLAYMSKERTSNFGTSMIRRHAISLGIDYQIKWRTSLGLTSYTNGYILLV